MILYLPSIAHEGKKVILPVNLVLYLVLEFFFDFFFFHIHCFKWLWATDLADRSRIKNKLYTAHSKAAKSSKLSCTEKHHLLLCKVSYNLNSDLYIQLSFVLGNIKMG